MSLNYLRPPIIAAICLLLIYTSHAYQAPQNHASGCFTNPNSERQSTQPEASKTPTDPSWHPAFYHRPQEPSSSHR
jgi:hypothetical protein